MSRPLWMRLSAPLIELQLTSTEAETEEQVWDLRLEGETIELTSRNSRGAKTGRIKIVRSEGMLVVAENE